MGNFKVRETVLKNGEKVTGMVVPIYPAKVLLQTDDMCLELSETEIQSLDGKEDFRNLIEPLERSIGEAMEVYQYNEDGSATSLTKHRSVNRSDEVLGKMRFLCTSSEATTEESKDKLREMFERKELFDGFGNLLRIVVDEELENGWRFRAKLLVPVVPGDSYETILKWESTRSAKRDDNHWVAQHNGQWTADIIFTLMFILPQGARFSSATPQPLYQFDHDGKPVVTWKRYMPKDEPVTFETRYEL